MPIVYLVIRAAGTEADALAFITRARTLQILVSSVVLALVVGLGTILIGVPIGWLTTRTNLPGRRLWAVLTVVPLAIPSYVTGFAFVAAFGPRGRCSRCSSRSGCLDCPRSTACPGRHSS